MDIKKAEMALLTAFILFLAPMAVYAGDGVMQDTLGQNEKLKASEELKSTNGRYTLVLQTDGNLVVYDSQGKPSWSSNTVGSGATECVMREDGNLLLKDRNGRVVWATDTDGFSNATLFIQDDGNVVLYKERGDAFWSNGKINMDIKPDAPPADVYMIARTASVTNRPIGIVENYYMANRGQGWGVIAKRLGIKPGSKEFHALKKDDTGLLSKRKSQGQRKKDIYKS